jgi:hypothetical protein
MPTMITNLWFLAVAALSIWVPMAGVLAQSETPLPTPLPTPVPDPFWPISLQLPVELGGAPPPKPDKPVVADLLVWVPEGATRLRAVMMVPANSDSKHVVEHAPLRAVAAKHGMGIIYMRGFSTGIEHWKEPTPPDGQNILKMLDLVAKQTGIGDFRHAPWVTFGKSSRGEFPFRAAWLFPDRVIASITYHGETPTWPVPDWAKLNGQSIVSVNLNGESEWGGTWFNHVRPSLLNYRSQKGWFSHIAVARGVGHGDYPDTNGTEGWGKPFPGKVTCIRVWDYLALFIDKALEIRLPKGAGPADGPVALNPIDPASGYLIDPFAVEETFGVPHLPLKEEGGLYKPGGGEEFPVSGYRTLEPLKGFTPGDGVPVVKFEPGSSPREWLITDSLKVAMRIDPMLELGDYAKLMPKVGDSTVIDDTTVTFQPLSPKQVGPNGGISMAGLKSKTHQASLLAYTVLDVAEKQTVIVNAGFTAATRIQLVLNGIPVRHKEVLELQPGKYPLLVALRMAANWAQIEPNLGAVSEANVKLAKEMQVAADAFAAEQAKLKASGAPTRVLIRKASEVAPAERVKMFWVPDREVADAWLKLHTPTAK